MMKKQMEARNDFMREFMQLDANAPATMEAVVEAVVRLSTYSEREVLELVSGGQLGELFPFHPRQQEIPPDFVAEEDLQEASALPVSRERQGALIQSSMPSTIKPSGPAAEHSTRTGQGKISRS
jgi:hypothetical protein